MQESGFAREYISDECLAPCLSARRWMTCNVVKEEKTMFRMYLDDSQSRFLLSAKRIGDCFYISQYEAFPEVRTLPVPAPALAPPLTTCLHAPCPAACMASQSVEEVPDCYYCAVLK